MGLMDQLLSKPEVKAAFAKERQKEAGKQQRLMIAQRDSSKEKAAKPAKMRIKPDKQVM